MNLRFNDICVGDWVCIVYPQAADKRRRVVEVMWKGSTSLGYVLRGIDGGGCSGGGARFISLAQAKSIGIHFRMKRALGAASWAHNFEKRSYLWDKRRGKKFGL